MTHTPLENLSSRELSQNLSKAKTMADNAPIVITERNEPAYVLMSYQEFNNIKDSTISSPNSTNHDLSEIKTIVRNLSIEVEMILKKMNQDTAMPIDKNFITRLNTMNKILEGTPKVLGESLDRIFENYQVGMREAHEEFIKNFVKQYEIISIKAANSMIENSYKPLHDLTQSTKTLSENLKQFKDVLLNQEEKSIVKSLIIQSIQSRYKEQLVVELSKTN
ncbi:type II toxin-antitoxin system Phd/YefM family antitoxin [Suttonella ornithocola]|uniref:Antitoxin n=1 Tax=Suttonella ornithocola TaxID=279832 RepID=A0A380MMQ6_9GAMM|nr:type II toxin-antitoxin system Phd/YefM family antitoxin [Suttonella ornithocola]SUO93021.1 antitoxin YefM [Suttonella ornithocola]